MMWELSYRADPTVVPLADRHYNRQKIGAPQFAPPGRCLVLATPERDAFWITSYPYAQYVRHRWAGAMVCSAFRNEGPHRSSDMIRAAVAASRWRFGTAEPFGMVTFVDRSKVRHKRDFGRCYRRAGWKECGETKGGLLALQLLPCEFPPATEPLGEFAFTERAP